VLELAMLGLLKEQPLHGYELKKRLGETLGSLWGVSYGSLYPALRRLERSGAIEIVEPATPARSAPVPTGSVKGDLAAARLRAVADRLASGGRRTRKAYRITEAGETLFVELMLGDDDRGDDERAFALKLAFCRHLPPAARLSLLERRRDALRARLAPARRGRAARSDRGTGRNPDRYLTALVEHRTRATQRDLEWVEGLIELERGDATPPAVIPHDPEHDHPIEQGATA
jgi:DNA-binding PadR family transcriptional regulator